MHENKNEMQFCIYKTTSHTKNVKFQSNATMKVAIMLPEHIRTSFQSNATAMVAIAELHKPNGTLSFILYNIRLFFDYIQ